MHTLPNTIDAPSTVPSNASSSLHRPSPKEPSFMLSAHYQSVAPFVRLHSGKLDWTIDQHLICQFQLALTHTHHSFVHTFTSTSRYCAHKLSICERCRPNVLAEGRNMSKLSGIIELWLHDFWVGVGIFSYRPASVKYPMRRVNERKRLETAQKSERKKKRKKIGMRSMLLRLG